MIGERTVIPATHEHKKIHELLDHYLKSNKKLYWSRNDILKAFPHIESVEMRAAIQTYPKLKPSGFVNRDGNTMYVNCNIPFARLRNWSNLFSHSYSTYLGAVKED